MKDLDCSSSSYGLDTPDCIILDDDDDEAVVPPSKVHKLDSDQDPLAGPSTGCTDQAQVPPVHGVPQAAAPTKAAEDKHSHRKGSERALATGSAPGQDPTWEKRLWPLVLHRGRIAQPRLPSCSQGTKLWGKPVDRAPAPLQGHKAVTSRSEPEDKMESWWVAKATESLRSHDQTSERPVAAGPAPRRIAQ